MAQDGRRPGETPNVAAINAVGQVKPGTYNNLAGAQSFRSQHGCLVPVRAFFKWLCRQNLLLANPAADLELPRAENRLPRHVLTAAEAERVPGLPAVAEPLGLRDRAMLEAFYSTGLRRMELPGSNSTTSTRSAARSSCVRAKGKRIG
jgi:site-specific recombinase XerD